MLWCCCFFKLNTDAFIRSICLIYVFETFFGKKRKEKKVTTNLSKYIYHAMYFRDLLDNLKNSIIKILFFLKFSCLFHMYVTSILFFVKTRCICNAYRLINGVVVFVVVCSFLKIFFYEIN